MRDLVDRPGAVRDRYAEQGLAAHYVAVVQGAMLLTKATRDRDAFARNLSHLKRYIVLVFDGR